MRSVVFLSFIVALLVIENVNSQLDNNYYQRRYYRRPYVISTASSGVIRTYVPEASVSEVAPAKIDLKDGQDDGKIRLDIYYATDCPDSMRFITRQLYPLYQEMDDVLDIHLVPYGKAFETYNSNTQKYDFRCQHGPSECYGNIVQSCVMSLYKKKDYMNFINCMESYPRPSLNGHKCARRLSMDWDKIDKCAEGAEGNRLLHEQAQLTQNLNPRLYFVPWIVVDKVYTETNQRMALRNLKTVVCNSYKGSHPKCPQ